MAKKLTKADREIHASALIKKKVKEAKQEIDLEALTEKITADVTKRLVGEFEGKV